MGETAAELPDGSSGVADDDGFAHGVGLKIFDIDVDFGFWILLLLQR